MFVEKKKSKNKNLLKNHKKNKIDESIERNLLDKTKNGDISKYAEKTINDNNGKSSYNNNSANKFEEDSIINADLEIFQN